MTNGKPGWTENQPDCRARIAGWGGAAIGYFTGTTLHVGPSHAVRVATQAARVVPTCGHVLPSGPCARSEGHRDRHRTRPGLDQESLRRRRR